MVCATRSGHRGGIIYLFLLSLILKAVRRQWLAPCLFVLLGAMILGSSGTSLAGIGRLAILLGAVAIALTRFGLLAAVTLVFTEFTLRSFPLTTNLSAWYVEWALAGLAAVLALALYGFVTTLKGRRL